MSESPCNIYDHQVIKLRTKVTNREILPNDMRRREIVFDDIDHSLYIKKNSEENIIRFRETRDETTTSKNTWSQERVKREQIKMSLILG